KSRCARFGCAIVTQKSCLVYRARRDLCIKSTIATSSSFVLAEAMTAEGYRRGGWTHRDADSAESRTNGNGSDGGVCSNATTDGQRSSRSAYATRHCQLSSQCIQPDKFGSFWGSTGSLAWHLRDGV